MNNYYEEHKDEYFDYNGVRYYTGTRFTIKRKYDQICTATFIGWDTFNKDLCRIQYKYPHNYYYTEGALIPRDEMQNYVIEIVEGNYYIEREKNKRYPKDSEIPKLFFGWIIYLIIMAILVIFKDRWLGWIAATIYFFYWRHKIKEEESYYVDE